MRAVSLSMHTRNQRWSAISQWDSFAAAGEALLKLVLLSLRLVVALTTLLLLVGFSGDYWL